MPISNAQPPVDNPVALIRSKMAAKQIFEARFLFRQLGDGIGTNEKMALAEELAAILSRAEQLLQRARACVAGGERNRAAELYREIEAMVIDMPGVAEESKSLTGAAALMAKISATASIAVDPEPPAEPAAISEAEEDEVDQPPPAAFSRQRSRRRPLWLAVGLIVIGAALGALWLIFPDAFSSIPFPTPPSQPAKNIVIRPLVSAPSNIPEKPSPEPSPPVVSAQPVEKTAEPIAPPPQPANPSVQKEKPPTVQASDAPGVINLGVLRIEKPRKK